MAALFPLDGRRSSALVILLAAAAPVRLQGQAHVPAPSPLVTWEDPLPQRGGVVLWARNPTQDPIRIDSLHIESCVNIRRGCGTRSLGLVLGPGTKKALARLEPAVPEDRYGYRWSVDWQSVRPDSVRIRPRSHRRSPWIRRT